MDSVILEWIRELGAWSWAVVGAVLLILEVIIPGVFLMWFGLAALALALQALVIPMPWQAQIVLYILYVAFFIWLSGRFQNRKKKGDETRPELNERSAGLVGQTFVLHKPIVNGTGAVRIDDTVWRVRGPDAPEGRKVKVTGSDGAVLMVVIDTDVEATDESDTEGDGGDG